MQYHFSDLIAYFEEIVKTGHCMKRPEIKPQNAEKKRLAAGLCSALSLLGNDVFTNRS